MSDSSASLAQSASSPFSSSSILGLINNPSSNMSRPMLFGSTSPSTGLSGPTQVSTSLFSVPSPAFQSSTSASALGHSSSSAVGSTAVSWADNPSSNLSTPMPVGSTGFSGLQTSVGQFGPTQVYSSLTSTFGVPSPAFGSSMSVVSASPTFVFGNSSSSLGSSIFGKKRAFNTSDSLDTSSQSCAATTSPAFGTTITPVTSVFGSSSTAFGVSLALASGSETPFQASSNSAGASSSPTFGSSTALALGSGVSSNLAFGAPTTPTFGLSSTSAFGQSTSACTFSSAPASSASSSFSFKFRSTPSSCQSNPSSGSNNVFPQPSGGSRLAPFIANAEVDGTGNFESISAMLVYNNKSPEELRWEDYQLGDKGGPGQSAARIGFGASAYRAPILGATSAPFNSSPFGAPSSGNHFSTTSSITPCTSAAVPCPAFGAVSTPFSSSPFGAPSSGNHFATTSSSTPCSSAFGASTSPSPFNAVSSQTYGSSLPYGQASAPGAAHALGSGLNFVITQPLLFSPVPANVVAFGYSVTPYIGQSPSTGIGHMLFTNTPLVLSPSNVVALCPNHSSTSAFGQSTSACNFCSAPASGASSAFSFGSTPACCQCNPSSISTNVFPQPSRGSRLAPFIANAEVDGTGNFESISAMLVYNNKSPEELRWEDYQLGDKGGPGRSAAGIGFGASSYRAPIFGATSAPFSSSPFGAPSSANHFATTSSITPCTSAAVSCPAFGATSTPFGSSPFGAPSFGNHFATTSSSTLCSPAFGASTSPSPFNAVSSQINGSSLPYGQASAPGAAYALGSGLNFVNTQSLLFSPVPANVVAFGYSATPYIGQSPSTGIGHMLFTNTPLVLSPSNSVALGSTIRSNGSFSGI